jgi:hypothetical protein
VRTLSSQPSRPAGRLAMAATVLFTPAQCRRATATTSGRGGAPSHCALLLPPRHRRRARGSVRAVPPEQSSLPQAPAAAAAVYGSAGDVKAALYGALEGANRGIFGMTSAKRSEIHGLVELLESRNPTPEPTAKLQDKVPTASVTCNTSLSLSSLLPTSSVRLVVSAAAADADLS